MCFLVPLLVEFIVCGGFIDESIVICVGSNHRGKQGKARHGHANNKHKTRLKQKQSKEGILELSS